MAEGASMAGGVHGGGHAWQVGCSWQGVSMAGGMCGRGRVWQGGMHGVKHFCQISQT